EGNLTLQNNNTATGNIVIQNNATLTASSAVAGLGRVYVVMGAIPGSPVQGSAPSNFVSNLSNGGVVYFGANGITTSSPNNTANVNGSFVLFNTGSLASSAISLGGGVIINSGGTSVSTIFDSLDMTNS